MASAFRDSSGILFMDYLKRKKNNSDYYCALSDRLKGDIKRKRPHLLKKKCISLEDSTTKIYKNDSKIQ